MSVTPSLTGCESTISQVKITHPINYALFLSFEFQPQQFHSLKLSSQSVTLDIPDLTSYISNFTDVSDQMAEDGLELKLVAEAVLEARTTYNEPNIFLDGELTFLPFVEDPDLLAIFVIVISETGHCS